MGCSHVNTVAQGFFADDGKDYTLGTVDGVDLIACGKLHAAGKGFEACLFRDFCGVAGGITLGTAAVEEGFVFFGTGKDAAYGGIVYTVVAVLGGIKQSVA